MSTPADDAGEVAECASCGEGMRRNECSKSQRPCGHHCNHSWTHDACDWCGVEFGEGGAGTTREVRVAVVLRREIERLASRLADKVDECVEGRVELGKVRAEADNLRAEVERLRKYAPSPEVEALLAQSSLGTDEAEAARDSVSADAGRLVVRLSRAMEERDEARAEADNLRAEVERLRDEVSFKTGQLIAARRHTDEGNAEVDSLRVTLAAVGVAIRNIRTQADQSATHHPSVLHSIANDLLAIITPPRTCQPVYGSCGLESGHPGAHNAQALAADPVSLADVREPDADDLAEWLETVLGAMVTEAERATTPEQAFHIAIRAVHAVRRIRFPVDSGYYGAFKSRMAIERVSGIHLGDYPERAIIDTIDDPEAVTDHG